jgi:hypothetical protein
MQDHCIIVFSTCTSNAVLQLGAGKASGEHDRSTLIRVVSCRCCQLVQYTWAGLLFARGLCQSVTFFFSLRNCFKGNLYGANTKSCRAHFNFILWISPLIGCNQEIPGFILGPETGYTDGISQWSSVHTLNSRFTISHPPDESHCVLVYSALRICSRPMYRRMTVE